jgi:hypothetical protein
MICEHRTVTSQGSATARFQRAIKQGNLFHAELAAREIGQLPLALALDLCCLMAAQNDPRFERAAVRWHGRFVVEQGVDRLSESQVVLGLISELPHNVREVEAALRRLSLRRAVVG